MTLWKYFGEAHKWVYERTGGRVGARMAGRDMLLLTTTGRRSGAERTLPLAYLRDGEAWVVVASNGGQPTHPAWLHNLRADPHARVRVGRDVLAVRAREADADERARLWPRLVAYNPPYGRYQRGTDREIPVVLLEPHPPRS